MHRQSRHANRKGRTTTASVVINAYINSTGTTASVSPASRGLLAASVGFAFAFALLFLRPNRKELRKRYGGLQLCCALLAAGTFTAGCGGGGSGPVNSAATCKPSIRRPAATMWQPRPIPGKITHFQHQRNCGSAMNGMTLTNPLSIRQPQRLGRWYRSRDSRRRLSRTRCHSRGCRRSFASTGPRAGCGR